MEVATLSDMALHTGGKFACPKRWIRTAVPCSTNISGYCFLVVKFWLRYALCVDRFVMAGRQEVYIPPQLLDRLTCDGKS
jgi:hypothetical protein